MSRFLWHSASHTGRKLLVHVTHSLPRPPPGVLSSFSYSLPVPIYTPKWRKALRGKSVSLRNIKADPILGQNPVNSTRSSTRFCISYGDDPEKHNKTNASLKNIIFFKFRGYNLSEWRSGFPHSNCSVDSSTTGCK